MTICKAKSALFRSTEALIFPIAPQIFSVLKRLLLEEFAHQESQLRNQLYARLRRALLPLLIQATSSSMRASDSFITFVQAAAA